MGLVAGAGFDQSHFAKPAFIENCFYYLARGDPGLGKLGQVEDNS